MVHHVVEDSDLLVQLATYNTNLQGSQGIPQDLVDWLAPTLQVSTFLSRAPRAPDIVAVGFQELLPLHLGLSGLSKSVINERNSHILSQIETHAPNKERYALIAKIVNVGVALLVYGRDDTIARTVCDVQTSWTGCGPLYMGNKGAVGIRFRIPGEDGALGEVFTFVCAHLTAHAQELPQRVNDYKHIVGTLLFPPLPSSGSKYPSTIYDTSNLFVLGDLNFRIALPLDHPLYDFYKTNNVSSVLDTEPTREELKEYDQLLTEQRRGTVLVGLREGDFWKFKCTYKYEPGQVDTYSTKRIPSWTDRILYAAHSDSADDLYKSNIKNLLYTSVPSYTTSDHKPVVAVLALSTKQISSSSHIPTLQLPVNYRPTYDPYADWKRYFGHVVDRIVGIIWSLFTVIGAGSAVVGIFNFVVGLGAWRWWGSSSSGEGTV